MFIAHSVLSLACAGTGAHGPHAAREVDQGVDLHVAFTAHPGLTWGQVQRAVKSRQAVPGAA